MPPKFKPKQPRARKAKTSEQKAVIAGRQAKEDRRGDDIKRAQQRSFALRKDPQSFLTGMGDIATAYTTTAMALVNKTRETDAQIEEPRAPAPIIPPGVVIKTKNPNSTIRAQNRSIKAEQGLVNNPWSPETPQPLRADGLSFGRDAEQRTKSWMPRPLSGIGSTAGRTIPFKPQSEQSESELEQSSIFGPMEFDFITPTPTNPTYVELISGRKDPDSNQNLADVLGAPVYEIPRDQGFDFEAYNRGLASLPAGEREKPRLKLPKKKEVKPRANKVMGSGMAVGTDPSSPFTPGAVEDIDNQISEYSGVAVDGPPKEDKALLDRYLPEAALVPRDSDGQGVGGISSLAVVQDFQRDTNIVAVNARPAQDQVRVRMDTDAVGEMKVRAKQLLKQLKAATTEEQKYVIKAELDELKQGRDSEEQKGKRRLANEAAEESAPITFGQENLAATMKGIKKYPGPANIEQGILIKSEEVGRRALNPTDEYRWNTSVQGRGGGMTGQTITHSNEMSNYVAPEKTKLKPRTLASIPDFGYYGPAEYLDETGERAEGETKGNPYIRGGPNDLAREAQSRFFGGVITDDMSGTIQKTKRENKSGKAFIGLGTREGKTGLEFIKKWTPAEEWGVRSGIPGLIKPIPDEDDIKAAAEVVRRERFLLEFPQPPQRPRTGEAANFNEAGRRLAPIQSPYEMRYFQSF